LGRPAAQRQVGHRQGGGGGDQHGIVGREPTDLGEDGVFGVVLLRQALDDEAGFGDVFDVRGDGDPTACCEARRSGGFVLLDTDNDPARFLRQTRDLRPDRTHPDDCHRFLSHTAQSGKGVFGHNEWVWHARPLFDEDIPEVVTMVNACELADGGEVMLTEADIVGNLAGADRIRDACVIVMGGRIVGWGLIWTKRKRWADVHPDARGQGIGTWLLRWAAWRSKQLGADRTGQTIDDTRTDVADWLAGHGYTPRYTSWVLSGTVPGATSATPGSA
jgi:GNAT superfamily N-acetyltransferase